jgi:cytochrome c oxidase subunit 2
VTKETIVNAASQDTTLTSGSFWLPPVISPETSGQDTLFYAIFYVSTFFFVLLAFCIIFFAWKYRKREGHLKPLSNVSDSKALEITWIAIPSLLLLIFFCWGLIDWYKMNVPPQDSLEVKVTARKWDWLFTYTDSGIDSSDLIVPVGKSVKLIMSSMDVIHGFYVPDFRIQKDVLPNEYTVLWFKAQKKGVYPVVCSQYCGTKHSQMIRLVKVVDYDDYKKLLSKAEGSGLSPAQLGQKIFHGKGACATCHDVSKDKKHGIGPPLFGLYGGKITYLIDGKPVEDNFNENYIRKSILDPHFRVVKGYPSVMPSYQGQLKEKELDSLIQYIKSLK